MKLVYSKDNLDNKAGASVRPGDQIMLESGERCTVESIQLPHKPSSTGRVTVAWDSGDTSTFFPSVINAKWINRTDI